MFVKGLLAGALALALFACHPVSAELTQATASTTLISDAVKFPREDRAVIDAVSRVNDIVNASMVYVTDKEHYGRDEKWVTWPEDGKGDCEDFALTKMEMLRQAGVPVIAVSRIRGVIVMDARGEILGAHAILELLLPNGSIAFLDNRFNELMTRRELEAHGYRFFDW